MTDVYSSKHMKTSMPKNVWYPTLLLSWNPLSLPIEVLTSRYSLVKCSVTLIGLTGMLLIKAEVKKNQLNAEALRLYGPTVQYTSGLALLQNKL